MGTRCTLLRPGILEYQDAWELQRRIADEVRAGADPALILLEHPPTYTLGARGGTENLLRGRDAYARRGATVVHSDRGGDVTFHGPGQIVGYPIMDLRKRGMGPVRYVCALEEMLIDALRGYGIDAARRDGARGVWAGRSKVAAIGVRVSRGVSMHGFALNVNTDLSWFDDIVPCGIRDGGVTSMAAIAGETFEVADVMSDVASAFGRVFGVDFVEEQTTDDRQQRVGDAGEATSLRVVTPDNGQCDFVEQQTANGKQQTVFDGEQITGDKQQRVGGRQAARGHAGEACGRVVTTNDRRDDFVEQQTANGKQQNEEARLTARGDAGEAACGRSGAGGPVEQAGVGFGR